MPNWCDNTLEIAHEDPVMIEKVVTAVKSGKFIESFIPFPNGEWDYDWCVSNWGTKWDVEPEITYQDESNVSLLFQSAWSPPMGLYPVLERMGYSITAMYYEPGMNFAGVYRDEIDECYELEDTADKVAEQIPTELDEEFGISQNMREWEAENEE